MSGPIPFVAAPTVCISEGVVTLHTESGLVPLEQAMSVKALGDRITHALDRYGRGEQDIVSD